MPAQNYTDIFTENRELLDRGSAAVMNDCRSAAYECLKRHGLPTQRVEEYLHTPISDWFEPDWGMNLGRVDIPVDFAGAFRCNVPNLSTQLYFLANDSFAVSESAQRVSLPDGVLAGSLKQLAKDFPELTGKYYAKIADMDRPGIAALNTMFAQDGFMIYVPDGVTVEKPVQLVTLLQAPISLMANRRILVVLGRQSSLKLLFCDHAMSDIPFLATQVIECQVGDGAHLDLYDLEETHTANRRVSELFLKQGADSSATIDTITLHNGMTRNSISAVLDGPGASLKLGGVAIADKRQHVDNMTFVDHRCPDCSSKELYKYVLDEHSTGVFAGKVLVRPNSQRTISQQTNRNICLTRESHMYTQPQLEIYADDVKCSHGATVGQLDEKAMFYMRQRGIPAPEARMLLMLAFVGEVTGRVELEPLRDRLNRLVDKRFRGELEQCEGCRACR